MIDTTLHSDACLTELTNTKLSKFLLTLTLLNQMKGYILTKNLVFLVSTKFLNEAFVIYFYY